MIALELLLAVPDLFGAALPGLLATESYDSDEGGSGWLLLAGPAAGAGVYWALFRHYRNTDKSHQFERETIIESQPVTGRDVKVSEVRGTQRSAIDGSNGRNHRGRVQRLQ